MHPRARAGESLVEVLAAILILTFGSIVLLTQFAAAARMSRAGSMARQEWSEAVAAMESCEETTPGTVTLTLGEESWTVDVVFSGEWVWFSEVGP